MQTYRFRTLDPTKILTRRELTAVLADLNRKAPRSRSTRLNLVIVRLACCCGLRASEIARLRVADVRVELPRPHLRIRRGAAKGGRPRIVPQWWDAGTLADLAGWKTERFARGPVPRRSLWPRSARAGRRECPCHATRSANGSARPARCWAGSAWPR